MTDLTDAELDVLEAEALQQAVLWMQHRPTPYEKLIAEVRRWRDKAADEAGLARLAAEIGRLADSVDHLGRKGPGGAAGFGEVDAPPGWIMPPVTSPGGDA